MDRRAGRYSNLTHCPILATSVRMTIIWKMLQLLEFNIGRFCNINLISEET